ncbi:MAG TPA: alpha/beta fold hydrolase [bacterium]|jgi:proline iminopeptidase|nr:alpha/beta fold hydrolase [bacterium]
MENRYRKQSAFCLWAAVCVLCFPLSNCALTAPLSKATADSGFVLVNGANLWYEIEGRGEPLLLIAGGPGSAHDVFSPHFSALADANRIIYFDAYGRGKSDRAKSPRGYAFARDVEDVEGIRKALNLGKINVLGHSYGGLVAQAYALRYPESVDKLILANTLFSGEMWQANNDNCNCEIRNQYPEVWERLQELRMQGYPSSAKEHQDVYAQVPIALFMFYDASNAGKLVQNFNPDVYYSIVGEDADFLVGGDVASLDFRTQLKNLAMPTLILASRFDRVCLPRFSVQFKQYAPQAQFVMFETAGHFTFVEDPDNMFAIVRSFLGK